MRVALAQFNSGKDLDANLELVRDYARQAADAGAALLVCPEATMRAFGHNLTSIAEPIDGPWASAVREIAQEAGVVVVVGMFTPGADGRVRNTLLVTGPGVDAHYDKVHLYDAFGYLESKTVEPGTAPVSVDIDGVRVGVTTCYDVRFPALYTTLANDGAAVIVVSASWGPGPGKVEQWELLSRARALDSTSWIVACGQSDASVTGVESVDGAPTGVGHSVVVRPDGTVLDSLGADAGLLVADIDVDAVDSTRKSIPVLANAQDIPTP